MQQNQCQNPQDCLIKKKIGVSGNRGHARG